MSLGPRGCTQVGCGPVAGERVRSLGLMGCTQVPMGCNQAQQQRHFQHQRQWHHRDVKESTAGRQAVHAIKQPHVSTCYHVARGQAHRGTQCMCPGLA